MTPKQDRQGVRTPADVERKYDLASESRLKNIVADAQSTALRAVALAEGASKLASSVADEIDALDRTELITRLTNGTGVISSNDESILINLVDNKVEVLTHIGEQAGKLEISSEGLIGYVLNEETYTQMFSINPNGEVNGLVIGGKAVAWKDNGDGTFILIGNDVGGESV